MATKHSSAARPTPGMAGRGQRRTEGPDVHPPASSEKLLPNIRLAYVAAETGARFVRDRLSGEPLDWLLSSDRLFGGERVLDACQRPEGFRRAVVLHGLGLPFQLEPELIAGIPAEDFVTVTGRPCTISAIASKVQFEEFPVPGLYCCSISASADTGHIQIFCAMIASGPDVVRRRLRQRFGARLEEEAVVRLGFDWSEPIACAMVSDAMAHVLSIAASDPASAFAEGLDFHVEQRFAT